MGGSVRGPAAARSAWSHGLRIRKINKMDRDVRRG
jgi:hypothetical protein